MYGAVIRETHQIGDQTVVLERVGDPTAPIAVVHLHRNEQTAWAAAQRLGVRAHSVAHGDTRLMRWGDGWVDPNRVFSGHPLGDLLVKAWDLRGARGIIATHNNQTDGALTVDHFAVHEAGRGDPHAFFLATTRRLFDALAGENRALQAADCPDDGSLSVWAARQGVPYINVEALHGDAAENERRLRRALAALTAAGP